MCLSLCSGQTSPTASISRRISAYRKKRTLTLTTPICNISQFVFKNFFLTFSIKECDLPVCLYIPEDNKIKCIYMITPDISQCSRVMLKPSTYYLDPSSPGSHNGTYLGVAREAPELAQPWFCPQGQRFYRGSVCLVLSDICTAFKAHVKLCISWMRIKRGTATSSCQSTRACQYPRAKKTLLTKCHYTKRKKEGGREKKLRERKGDREKKTEREGRRK